MKIEIQKSFNVLLVVIALSVIFYFIEPHVSGLLQTIILIAFVLIALFSLSTIFKREYDE